MTASECLTLTPTQVEAKYGIKRNHLSQLRYQHRGPRFIQATPRTVLYRTSDIEEWLNANTVETRESKGLAT